MINMNDTKALSARLAEVQAMNLPHMTIESFRKVNGSFDGVIDTATEEEKEAISKVLHAYLDDSGDKRSKCIINDEYPSLRWALNHGAMMDENTGLTWIMYHYFVIKGERRRYESALQYHPDAYFLEEESEEENQ